MTDARRWARGTAIAVSLAAALACGGTVQAATGPGGPPGTTLVATVNYGIPGYARPGGRTRTRVPGTWYGAPSILPVIGVRPGWVRVRLAQRPNGSTAWVRSGDVTLSRTAYRIVIGLDRRRLTLYRQGRRVFSAPAGVGTRAHPTPAGHFFVAFFEHLPGYGPFIMVTSAHSNTIHDWAGSHDAVVGIHGPLGDGAAIGAAGARVSHGCVRLRDGALLRLRRVPPGTPIDIRHAVRRNSVSGSQL